MTVAQVLACDHIQAPPQTDYGIRDRLECPSVSRAVRSGGEVLRTVAGRDGWVLLPDGRHLCPVHAAVEAVAS